MKLLVKVIILAVLFGSAKTQAMKNSEEKDKKEEIHKKLEVTKKELKENKISLIENEEILKKIEENLTKMAPRRPLNRGGQADKDKEVYEQKLKEHEEKNKNFLTERNKNEEEKNLLKETIPVLKEKILSLKLQNNHIKLNILFGDNSYIFLKFCGGCDRAKLREVCKTLNKQIFEAPIPFFEKDMKDKWPRQYIFKNLLQETCIITPLSSEISEESIGDNTLHFVKKAKKSVLIVSDQINHEDFLDKINSKISITLITEKSKSNLSEKYKNKIKEPIKDIFKKMHNKFILIDDYGIITGSPNVTLAGYEYNIESCVAAYSKPLYKLYKTYSQWLIDGKDQEKIKNYEITKLKSEAKTIQELISYSLQAFLAPIVEVNPPLQSILNLTKKDDVVDVSMFLMDPNNEVVKSLKRLPKKEVIFSLKVDKSTYDSESMGFMKQAVTLISQNEPKALLIIEKLLVKKHEKNDEHLDKRKKEPAILHDKLFLIKSGKTYITSIGSSGLTKDVSKNNNAENMILINDQSVYNFFKIHFDFMSEKNTKNFNAEDLLKKE